MTDDLALTAEKIMLRAKKENKRSDDMTVELLRIEAPAKNAMDKVPSVTGEFSPFGDDFSVQIGG